MSRGGEKKREWEKRGMDRKYRKMEEKKHVGWDK